MCVYCPVGSRIMTGRGLQATVQKKSRGSKYAEHERTPTDHVNEHDKQAGKTRCYHSICYHIADVELGEMPDRSRLAGVLEFKLTQQSMEATPNMAKLMSLLGETSKIPPFPLMALGEELPALPKKSMEKILTGEYVYFAEFPPARGKVKSSMANIESQILVVQAVALWKSKKLIPDLAKLVQCFSIFAAVATA